MVWKNCGSQIFISLQWRTVSRSIIQEKLDRSPENSIFSSLPLACSFLSDTFFNFSHIWKWQNKSAARKSRPTWENSETLVLPRTCTHRYFLTFQIDLLIVLIQYNHHPKITALAFSHFFFNAWHKCCTLCFLSELPQFLFFLIVISVGL